jgi:hypothetical protein
MKMEMMEPTMEDATANLLVLPSFPWSFLPLPSPMAASATLSLSFSASLRDSDTHTAHAMRSIPSKHQFIRLIIIATRICCVYIRV